MAWVKALVSGMVSDVGQSEKGYWVDVEHECGITRHEGCMDPPRYFNRVGTPHVKVGTRIFKGDMLSLKNKEEF